MNTDTVAFQPTPGLPVRLAMEGFTIDDWHFFGARHGVA
jgi:hypothetical protein